MTDNKDARLRPGSRVYISTHLPDSVPRPPSDQADFRSLEKLYKSAEIPDEYANDLLTFRRAWMELCLVVADRLYPKTEARLRADCIYNDLSDAASKVLNPSRGGIGITGISNVRDALLVKSKPHQKTLYTVGPLTSDVLGLVRKLDGEIDEVAEATKQLVASGDCTQLKNLGVRFNDPTPTAEGHAPCGTDSAGTDEPRTQAPADRNPGTGGISVSPPPRLDPLADRKEPEDVGPGPTAPGDNARGPERKRGGALGHDQTPNESKQEPDEKPTDVDSEGGQSVRKNHFCGELRSKVPVPKPVSGVLEDVLDAVNIVEEYRPALRHMVAHIYYCQTRMPGRYSDGVPIYYELIKDLCRNTDGVEVPSRTKNIYEDVEGELLDVSEYIYGEEGVGQSREFCLTDELMCRLDDALEDSYQYKTRYNLVNGKRLYSGFQTQLTYDGEHSWKQRSVFIYKTLKRLRGQRDVVNKDAVEDHLDRLRDERDAARGKCEQLQLELDAVKGDVLDEGKTLSEHEQERLSVVRDELFAAVREKERIESRYRQDLRIWADIIAQGLEETGMDGIYEYETAYEVQLASGRFTQTCGLQNASEEMKAAASEGIPNYNNVDITSSQTEGLIQEMQMAVRMGADLDVSVLTDYINEDGKDGLAEQFGIGRENWKRPEHAVKFGAGFNHETYEAAFNAAKGQVLTRIKAEDGEPDFSQLHQHEHENGRAAWLRAVYNELATMGAVARDWADDDAIEYDDPEKVYSILRDAYGDMAEELDAWREWLVDEYWIEAGQDGSQFGYYVSNPCSLPFSIYDGRLAESGDEPDRYNQKAGFATSRLQGLEAAYIHALTLIQDDFDYEVLRNEHDGAVTLGEVSEEAQEMARRISGFHRAQIEEKPFESHESNSNDTEDATPCSTTTSSPQLKPSPQARPSKSHTSPSEENSADGSADGKAVPNGARNERTPSGSPRRSPVPLRSTSDTSCKESAPSDSSTGPSQRAP